MLEGLGAAQGGESTASPSVLWKAFEVLGGFTGQRPVTLSELARRSGLPKSTTHRVLSMLVEVKAVDKVGQRYRMGVRMFSMGACSAEVDLRNTALPHLERLRQSTKQTVHLAVLDGYDVVYLEKLVTPASARGAAGSPALIGGRLPAHATGVGKALLAQADDSVAAALPLTRRTGATMTDLGTLQRQLQHVREVGFAADRGEATPGLACVATPIIVDDRAVAAVSVAFSTSGGSGRSLLVPLWECTASIGRALGARAGAELGCQ